MATAKENARSQSMQLKIRRGATNAVGTVSPMLFLFTHGLKKSVAAFNLSYDGWKNVLWGQASGTSYGWRVIKTVGTAKTDTGQLRTVDFKEQELLAKPSIEYYMASDTWAIGEGDRELNRNDETKITSIKQDRMTAAQDSVLAALADWPWNIDETGHDGGLTMFSPTAVAASTTYAGIALNAGAYWQPTGYDYGDVLTLAANFFAIVSKLKRQLTLPENAGGGGRRL